MWFFTIQNKRETLKNLNMVNLNGEKLYLHLSCNKSYKWKDSFLKPSIVACNHTKAAKPLNLGSIGYYI
jgi:hypothetical protein